MRLDKFISGNTNYTRSDIKKLIKAQRVTINAKLATHFAAKINVFDHIIEVDGRQILPVGNVYYMLNKPIGYVCTHVHDHHPTIFDLISNVPLPQSQLQIVGRLDIDTTGLVLLTNDGQWNHRITSPRSHCKKYYQVELSKPVDNSVGALFADGIQLQGEKKPTLPAQLTICTPHSVQLAIAEGKYHQVKRMFVAVDNQVKTLHRFAVGSIQLDPQLDFGQYRPLTDSEINSIK